MYDFPIGIFTFDLDSFLGQGKIQGHAYLNSEYL